LACLAVVVVLDDPVSGREEGLAQYEKVVNWVRTPAPSHHHRNSKRNRGNKDRDHARSRCPIWRPRRAVLLWNPFRSGRIRDSANQAIVPQGKPLDKSGEFNLGPFGDFITATDSILPACLSYSKRQCIKGLRFLSNPRSTPKRLYPIPWKTHSAGRTQVQLEYDKQIFAKPVPVMSVIGTVRFDS